MTRKEWPVSKIFSRSWLGFSLSHVLLLLAWSTDRWAASPAALWDHEVIGRMEAPR